MRRLLPILLLVFAFPACAADYPACVIGIDDGHDPVVLVARLPRCDGLDARPAAGEDGDAVAAGRTGPATVDEQARPVLEARERLAVDHELDRFREARNPAIATWSSGRSITARMPTAQSW